MTLSIKHLDSKFKNKNKDKLSHNDIFNAEGKINEGSMHLGEFI